MDLARSRTTARRLRAAYVVVAAADTLLAGTEGERAHRARLLSKPLLMPLLAASLATDPRAATSPLRLGPQPLVGPTLLDALLGYLQ